MLLQDCLLIIPDIALPEIYRLALPLDMISLYLVILNFVTTLMIIQRPVGLGSFAAF